MVVAHLVGRIARLENIPFLYYTGDLSYGARKSALDRFKSDDSVKLMVSSSPSFPFSVLGAVTNVAWSS